jgi:hypothetical protein
MFDVFCPRHGRLVLLGPRNIVALENTTDGIVLRWRCRCGATGTELLGAPRAVDPGDLGPAA